jgi:membrane protein
VVSSRNIAGIAGILGLLWAGTAVFGAIRKGINATWGITTPRPFFQERLIDISLMVGAAVLMFISISSTAMLAYLREIMQLITNQTLVNGDILWNRLASLIPPVLSFIVFTGLYWFLPNIKVRLGEVWPGALAATIAFEVVKNLFVWYVRTYPVYESVYGSVGSIMALLTWVYVSAVILLFGSLITSRYAAHRAADNRAEAIIVSLVNGSLQPAHGEGASRGR